MAPTEEKMRSSTKVMVTGAGGFIGSHLAVELIRRGHRVAAVDLHLDRLAHLRGDPRVTFHEGDVTSADVLRPAVAEVDTVYHLAAAHLSVAAGDDEFFRVNVDGLRRLVEWCRQAEARRFVQCSSVGVFGHIADPPANEDSPCHPDIAYERSKLAGEGVVLEACRDGFPATILRPAWVYGPGCPRTEKLFRSIRKGRFIVAGDGGGLRHCIYIRDMVTAFRLAAERDEALGQVIIVGDCGAVTIRRLVDEIAGQVGARPPRSVPLPLLSTAAVLAEIAFKPLRREPPISRRTLKFFTANTAFDTARARRLLGFRPAYDLRSGLAETRALLGSPAPWMPDAPAAVETGP